MLRLLLAMAIAIVQRVPAMNSASGTTVAATVSATGAGRLLVAVCFNFASRTVTGVSDGTNNFTQVPGVAAATGSVERCDIWYLPVSAAGKTTITASFSGAAGTDEREMEFYEVSGFTTPVVDQAGKVDSGASTAGGVLNGASVTTAGAAGFIAAGSTTTNTIDQNPLTGNEFTSGGDIFGFSGFAACSLISASAAAHQPKWRDSALATGTSFCSSTAAFKESSVLQAPLLGSLFVGPSLGGIVG